MATPKPDFKDGSSYGDYLQLDSGKIKLKDHKEGDEAVDRPSYLVQNSSEHEFSKRKEG